MVMLATQLLVLVTALLGKKHRDEPIDTYVVVDKDDFSGYDNCETPGECAAPCASPQTFQVRMCASHMCTLCGEPWCRVLPGPAGGLPHVPVPDLARRQEHLLRLGHPGRRPGLPHRWCLQLGCRER